MGKFENMTFPTSKDKKSKISLWIDLHLSVIFIESKNDNVDGCINCSEKELVSEQDDAALFPPKMFSLFNENKCYRRLSFLGSMNIRLRWTLTH